VAAVGLLRMGVSCTWGKGNDSLDVMLDSGQDRVCKDLAVDNEKNKGASALPMFL
jgi:hypothetical protein